ncbi:hypothetical protein [Nocardioides sp. KR10-350]|uniref:hypothetical protein n=1 Tax=Nocardioides cheoyonin TaxID=3156615 RepID=UPI0032B35AC1
MPDQLTAPPPPPIAAEGGPPSRFRLSRPVALQVLAVLVLGAVLGAAGGLLVHLLWSPPDGMVVNHVWYRGLRSTDPVILAQNTDQAVFSGVGWFVVVAVAAGVLLGAVAALFLDREEYATLAAVVVASVGAGLLAYAVATGLAAANPDPLARSAPDGTVLPDTLRLGSRWIVLACPAGALIALMAVFLLLRPKRRVEGSRAG